jgi:hypothetical protein
MPMRAYRAGTAYAGAHAKANMGLWIAVSIVITVVLGFLNWQLPQSNVWGHLFAIAGMVVGTLVMMKSQEGYVAPEMPDEDNDGTSVQPMA